jgi:hypothetical protein
MRIAVLVYGRLARCAEHYENTINAIGTQHTIDFFASSDNSANIDEFVRIYKPISYINETIENTYNLDKYRKRLYVAVDNMVRHFINKQRVLSLLEKHDAKYDAIVSLRIDCVFTGNFNFDNIDDNTIYVPQGNNFYGLNDQIAYGKPAVMKLYNSIFSNLMLLLEESRSVLHPESLTLANVQYHNLKIVRVVLQYFIER